MIHTQNTKRQLRWQGGSHNEEASTSSRSHASMVTDPMMMSLCRYWSIETLFPDSTIKLNTVRTVRTHSSCCCRLVEYYEEHVSSIIINWWHSWFFFFFRFIALCKANIINKRDKELAMYAFFARNESCRSWRTLDLCRSSQKCVKKKKMVWCIMLLQIGYMVWWVCVGELGRYHREGNIVGYFASKNA